MWKWCLLFAFLISASCSVIKDTPAIKIRNGYVKGIINQTRGLGTNYYAFRAIPYAEPPIGSLRFEPPIPKSKWLGVFDATKDGVVCVQGGNPSIGSEDCLYVNVYTPNLNPSKSLPVMAWIHGGAFLEGKCTYDEYGPDYFLEKDVVVVTFSYRLGIFGFLSTGDTVVPGNNGLKDQVLALKWVQDNIGAFGGDPKQVTVFGGSAGSVSTSYLLQTPLSKGLFSGAIMQSGVSLSLWGLSRSVAQVAYAVGIKMGVNATDSLTLVNQLKKLDAAELQATASAQANQQLVDTNPRDGLVYAPVIEPEHPNALFTAKSHHLLAQGNFHAVPCIVGFNSLEANFELGALIKLYLLKEYEFAPQNLVPIDMNIKDAKEKEAVGKLIKTHYFGNKWMSKSDYEIKKFITDDQFVRAVREFVRLLSLQTDVYFYRFAYDGGMSGYVNKTVPGAAHSEEIAYMWNSHFPPTSENDIITRSRMVTMWTNFAKYGNPTPVMEPVLDNILWLKASSMGDTNTVFLNINETLSLGVNPENEDIIFWEDLYKKYATPPLDTF